MQNCNYIGANLCEIRLREGEKFSEKGVLRKIFYPAQTYTRYLCI